MRVSRSSVCDAADLVLQAEEAEELGLVEDATELVERALALEPANTDAWLRLARLHLVKGSVVHAHRALARAQSLAPEDPRVVATWGDLNVATRVDLNVERDRDR